jgi:hypothetical protein
MSIVKVEEETDEMMMMLEGEEMSDINLDFASKERRSKVATVQGAGSGS